MAGAISEWCPAGRMLLPGTRAGPRIPSRESNKAIKRRTDVVGVFLNPAALLRLAGAVLVEQHDEYQAADGRYFSEASMAELKAINNPSKKVETIPEISAASTETTAPHSAVKLHTQRTSP